MATVLALLALLTLVMATVSSLERRRRDFAILRSLGVTPAQIAGAVVAQAVIATVTVIVVSGTHVAITRPGTTELQFTDNGYHTEATGGPIDLYFIDVDGQTLSILVDAHTASGADATAFHEAVTGILESLSFDS